MGRCALSPTDPTNPAQPRRERRRHLRLKVAVEVRLHVGKQATPPLKAQTADISLGGCYVEMMFTLEVGTKVYLTIFLSDAAKVNVEGVVVTRDMQVGNGVQFTAMSTEDNARLRHFLATVR
jgi:c-di-GMP-binding flagellar brake protein YcgR